MKSVLMLLNLVSLLVCLTSPGFCAARSLRRFMDQKSKHLQMSSLSSLTGQKMKGKKGYLVSIDPKQGTLGSVYIGQKRICSTHPHPEMGPMIITYKTELARYNIKEEIYHVDKFIALWSDDFHEYGAATRAVCKCIISKDPICKDIVCADNAGKTDPLTLENAVPYAPENWKSGKKLAGCLQIECEVKNLETSKDWQHISRGPLVKIDWDEEEMSKMEKLAGVRASLKNNEIFYKNLAKIPELQKLVRNPKTFEEEEEPQPEPQPEQQGGGKQNEIPEPANQAKPKAKPKPKPKDLDNCCWISELLQILEISNE